MEDNLQERVERLEQLVATLLSRQKTNAASTGRAIRRIRAEMRETHEKVEYLLRAMSECATQSDSQSMPKTGSERRD